MEKEKIKLFPATGILLAVLLYLVSLNFRGFFLPEEYVFAVRLRSFFPELSGSYLPKLPAALATLMTAGIIWLTASRFKLLHPGNAAGIYLCFPPVWWLGTSALPSMILAFLIDLAAAGLFFFRREKAPAWRWGGLAAGVAGAVGAAWAAQNGFFDWSAVVMAFMPMLALTAVVALEKLDDRQQAGRKLNRVAVWTAVTFGLILIFLLLPSFARMLKVDFPVGLMVFRQGERVYRSALALLIPMLWLYALSRTENYTEKLFALFLAVGFVLLTLPPSLPWNRLAKVPQPEQLESVFPVMMHDKPVFYADDSTSAALSYVYGVKVFQVGRNPGDMPPAELPDAVRKSLEHQDVIVVSFNGELDDCLPTERSCVKNTLHKCKFFRFTGDKK